MAVSLALARNIVLGETLLILVFVCLSLTCLLSGTTNVFALIVLGLAAFTLTQTPLGYYFTFSALGVSTSLIHLLSMNGM